MTSQSSIDQASEQTRQFEIEQFLYREADLLDSRRFHEWLEFFTADIRYWMPVYSNVSLRDAESSEISDGALDIATMDEDMESLTVRVKRMDFGTAWAEDPPSRTRRLITNVRVEPADKKTELNVTSNFLLYRDRLRGEEDLFVGRRNDLMRREDGELKIARRQILIGQAVLQAKNISVFF